MHVLVRTYAVGFFSKNLYKFLYLFFPFRLDSLCKRFPDEQFQKKSGHAAKISCLRLFFPAGFIRNVQVDIDFRVAFQQFFYFLA